MQIIIKLTTACNLNCVYCSEGEHGNQFIDKEILYKMIDELPELLDYLQDEEIELLWHGGEPLLYGKDNIISISEYAYQKLSSKYKISFLMQTNGYLIDDEWIQIFKKYNIGVGVSLDGYQELHDLNRRTKNNEPTFEKVMKNIHKMKKAGLKNGNLMVLNTNYPVNVSKLFDFLQQEKLHIKIHPIVPCGRADNREDAKLVYDNYIKLMIELYEKSMRAEDTIIIEPLNKMMDAILGITSIGECSFSGSCGIKFMCLYTDGFVSFCGRRADEFQCEYGSLLNNSMLELYKSVNAEKIRNRSSYLKEHDCKNCDDWSLCHGGCTFEAVNANGIINSRYPNCEERKKLLTFLKTKGLIMLKERLLKEKAEYRHKIKVKKRLLEELKNARK